MGSKTKLRFHQRLFLILLLFSWTIVGCFLIFQYGRERQFKAEQLDARLQLYNMRLLEALRDGKSPSSLTDIKAPFEDLRVSVISMSGLMIFDNTLDSLPDANHLDRPEIAEALSMGTGCVIRRHSDTTKGNYFYSAMAGDSVIVRTAAPYSIPLQSVLSADSGFLWFMLSVTLVMGLAAYFVTRRLGRTISRLNAFAQKAERGERIYDDEPFPHDELGEISGHIIRLYARLQKATIDRDSQHKMAMHEQQEKIRIKKQLTNNINHELKTPVTAIQVCLETLLSHPDIAEEKRADFLQRCYNDSERLRRLLADVSTITRMDEGSQAITKGPLDLSETIRDAVSECKAAHPEPAIEIHTDCPETLLLTGNCSLLASVFRNLLDNAMAYSDGKNIFISVVEDTPLYCKLIFADDGVGIEETHLPHIFERFYRVDKGRSRKLGGTGLGLSIVKNAILFHGGTVTACNRPAGGLEFTFTLMK